MTETLFPDAPAAKPECKLYDERFDWYEAYCRARYAAPENWQIFKWEVKNHDRPGKFTLVEGGVFLHTITKGKRKGRVDYKKPEPGTLAIYPISNVDLDKFKAEWSQQTGKCHTCYGTGQQWWGWDHIDGAKFRDCTKCDATGSDSSGIRKGEK